MMTRSHRHHHTKESADDRHRRKQSEKHFIYDKEKGDQNIIDHSEDPQKKQEDKENADSSKVTVTSETLPLFDNIPYPTEVAVKPVTVKIPVVLTEFTVPVTVESLLKLDAKLEIKHVRKNVFLSQCKLIPDLENGNPNAGILFLEGFIRKNIEYTSKEHNDNGRLLQNVNQTTVKVPFKCTTRVRFKTPPIFKRNIPQEQVEMLQNRMKVYDFCDESISGRDICEQNFKIIEFFNEKVVCDLTSAEIIETDIVESLINEKSKSSFNQPFYYITEKVIVLLTIKLLQNQNVEI